VPQSTLKNGKTDDLIDGVYYDIPPEWKGEGGKKGGVAMWDEASQSFKETGRKHIGF
jgi:hypothetical protein